MLKAEVEEEMIASGAAAASISARDSIFTSISSGTLSWMNAAPSTASARVAVTLSRSREAPAASPRSSSAGQAASTWVHSRSAPSGAGSQAATS